MSSLFVAAGLFFATSVAHAAAPLTLTQSGRLLDGAGTPLNGAQNIRVTLYDTTASPSGFWSRLYAGVNVEDGFYAVSLVSDDAGVALDPVDFADGDTWVQVSVNGAAMGARRALGSVPYALVSGSGGSPFFCSDGGGTWCPGGRSCVGGTCLADYGMASSNPAVDCKDLHAQQPTYANGTYWIDPTGASPQQAYCLMDDAGGGWTLVARVNGADAQGLMYNAWTSAPTGTAADFSTTTGSDALFDAYGSATGTAVLFYDASALCGADRRLLETPAFLGGQTLLGFISGLSPVIDTSATTQSNFVVPAFRNTGCTHPFNPSGATLYFAGNRLGMNVISVSNAAASARFTVNQVSYDNGVAGTITPDGGYGIGDLDAGGDSVVSWAGHVLTVFVR